MAGHEIYFVSDRDENKRMNLFVYDLKTKSTRQCTHFKDYDVKFPSLGDEAIVFENGGFLYRYDFQSQQAVKVPVYLHEDLAGGRGGLKSVGKEVTTYDLSPDGERVVFAPGRRFHRACQGRQYAQPDADLRRPRAKRNLVARRQVDRLHLRRHRRR